MGDNSQLLCGASLTLAPTEQGKLFLAEGDLNGHSALWDEHQPTDQRGEPVEDSQNVRVLKDGTATCVNRGTGSLNIPDITAVINVWSTVNQWTVGEDLGSGHH